MPSSPSFKFLFLEIIGYRIGFPNFPLGDVAPLRLAIMNLPDRILAMNLDDTLYI